MPLLKIPLFPPVTPDDSDGRLALAACSDPSAFSELYQRWVAVVYRYFYHRTRYQAAAEDLTSQLFLAVYQALPRYQHRGHFAAWLFTIAGNLFNQYLRQSRRELPLHEDLPLPSPSDPLAEAINLDEIRRLQVLVKDLPEREQELIRLRYVAALSFADIARVLNKREDTVKKSLYRLQARLQSLLEQ